MRTSEFDYHLPPELIAQTPLEPRDSSRLLLLDRATGRTGHRRFHDLPEYVRPGDVMVFNQSRVIPARLFGRREDTGGKVELLLLHRESPGVWRALAQPGRRLRPGMRIVLDATGKASPPPSKEEGPPGLSPDGRGKSPPTPLYERGAKRGFDVEVLASHAGGIKTVRLESEEDIGRLGVTPLPPYIHRRLEDPERYQTVYARHPGSAAAPTAGLHFTEPLLARLKDAGVEPAFVTLHVGLDTFRPVQSEDPLEHTIHTEYYELSREAANILNGALAEGRRIIAVGTTSVRVLEQVAQRMAEEGRERVDPCRGQAGLFILPGHKFQLVDALITNFHLPRSTLLMLVSAFAGREPVLRAYREAISEGYRFYSFGDAMMLF
ncbi:MAG: tRNA preQ1(34) S-adenosylmethionine ribosyltransferase-isomerase QueA [Dehalococcoidia bacterium]|jgi:S-adenosylmethionine:tRNA ribosyltransferase-isomerase|nr:tRNA preQ1(34) S-adenosylmethionine ribosyltransferase-isomerase QueA [Dehalococcoidia bacterium]